MARDYTKYSVVGLGETLNKRQLVYTIVKDFIEKNNPTLETLLSTFPDELQGSKGVVRKESDVDDPKRFNMKAPLKIKNGMHIVVSNQWGDNLPGFIQHVENRDAVQKENGIPNWFDLVEGQWHPASITHHGRFSRIAYLESTEKETPIL